MTVKRFRFSLIELLAVIALVSLLTALMLPAFRKMTAGNAVDQMASQIKLALEQAQSHAAVSRKLTAVIFYTDSNVKLKFGGYRLAEVEKVKGNNNVEYHFSQWVDDSEWRPRVEGTILSKIIDTNPTPSNDNPITGLPTNNSTGNIIVPNNFQQINNINNANCAIIFRSTGGTVLGSNLYIVVSEATFNGDQIKTPGYADGQTQNYKVIMLRNLTGKCEYLR